jgi:hypothetical protein
MESGVIKLQPEEGEGDRKMEKKREGCHHGYKDGGERWRREEWGGGKGKRERRNGRGEREERKEGRKEGERESGRREGREGGRSKGGGKGYRMEGGTFSSDTLGEKTPTGINNSANCQL